ncbi:MAG: SRPBCC domain-containing protein [Saprospiraceae bacterium]|nr:SRPBCC domain-containing protein [Saprospiraceae bacterium]
MNKSLLFRFDVDTANRQIRVERSFNAPPERVWAAWTEADILDQWWAPNPWVTRTKIMDFREGGYWLYAMVGPEEETHWCRADFVRIVPGRSIVSTDAFCDEEGRVNESMPPTQWEISFHGNENTTTVVIVLSFRTMEDLGKILEMGFREGFTSGLANLDRYFDDQLQRHNSAKPN